MKLRTQEEIKESEIAHREATERVRQGLARRATKRRLSR